MRRLALALLLVCSTAHAEYFGHSRFNPKAGYWSSSGTPFGGVAMRVCTQTADDTTPSMNLATGDGCNVLLTSTSHSGGVTVTGLDDVLSGIDAIGAYEQHILIIGQAATNQTTISDGGNFVLKTIPWDSPASGDHSALELETKYMTGSITAFADAGGGQVTVTSASHGLQENQSVTISGTTSYNGTFTATSVATNTFEITDTWVADDATGTWVSVRFDEVSRSGNVDDYFYQNVYVKEGNATDFANSQMVVGESDTGTTSVTAKNAIAAEASADGSNPGIGVLAYGETSSAQYGTGGMFLGIPNATGDTTTAYGARVYSSTTHASGDNVGLYARAVNGNNNYALQIEGGDINSITAANWLMIDNTASALSWDAAGAADIFKIVTTDGEETIAHASKLTGSSALDAGTGDEYAWDLAYETNKATSGDSYGLRIVHTDTASPAGAYLLHISGTGSMVLDSSGDLTLDSGAAATHTTTFAYNTASRGEIQANSADFTLTATGTNPLLLESAALSTTNDTAAVSLLSGDSSNTGDYDSGAVTVESGTSATAGDSGAIIVRSGNAADTSGAVSLYSGTSANAGESSGAISIYSGAQSSATGGSSGVLYAYTGDAAGSSGSGGVSIYSGAQTNSGDVDSGNVSIYTGDTTTDGDSGDLTLRTGAAGAGSSDAGDFVVQTHGTNTRLTIAGDGGDATFTADVDVEGTGAIGNGSALAATDTLIVDRDFSTATTGTQLSIFGVTTVTGGTSDVANVLLAPSGTTLNDGGPGVHGVIASVEVREPNITETVGTVTSAATLRILDAPTEGDANYSLWVDAGATQLDGTLDVEDATTLSSTLDAESYAAIGNGSALNATGTLIVDRDFSTATNGSQIRSTGIITVTGGSSSVEANSIAPEGVVINDAGPSAHALVASLGISEPVITETVGTVTEATTLYIKDAPTEGDVNYALHIDSGNAKMDGDLGVDGTITAGALSMSGDLDMNDNNILNPAMLYMEQEASDTAPDSMMLKAASAYAQSTVNTQGGTLKLAGGTGIHKITVVQATAAGSTLTFEVDETITTITMVAGAPGANEVQCITDDDTCAAALAAYLDSNIDGFTATAVSNVVWLDPDVDTMYIAMYSSDGTGTKFAVVDGDEGEIWLAANGVRIHGGRVATTNFLSFAADDNEKIAGDGSSLYFYANNSQVMSINASTVNLKANTNLNGYYFYDSTDQLDLGNSACTDGHSQGTGDTCASGSFQVDGVAWFDDDVTLLTGKKLYLGSASAYLSNGGSVLDGSLTLDNTGATVNSPSLQLLGDVGGTEVEGSIYLAQGAQPYLIFSVDDDSTTPALTAILHLDDESIRPASAGLLAAGTSTLYFSDVVSQALTLMDSANDNTIAISAAADEGDNRTLTLTMGGNRTLSIEGNTVLDQDYSADASPGFASITTSSGTASHVFGGTTYDYSQFRFTGNFTSGGADQHAEKILLDGALTGAAGDTQRLAGAYLTSNIATQAAEETIGIVSQMHLVEPTITNNLTGAGVITDAATLYIASAPTEGSVRNAALLVEEGATILDGTLDVGGDSEFSGDMVATPSSDTALGAAATLTATQFWMRVVGDSGAQTLGDPNIADAAADGTRVCLQGTDDTNTVTIQDETTNDGSGMELDGNVSFTLGENDVWCGFYDAGEDRWIEISRSNNTNAE